MRHRAHIGVSFAFALLAGCTGGIGLLGSRGGADAADSVGRASSDVRVGSDHRSDLGRLGDADRTADSDPCGIADTSATAGMATADNCGWDSGVWQIDTWDAVQRAQLSDGLRVDDVMLLHMEGAAGTLVGNGTNVPDASGMGNDGISVDGDATLSYVAGPVGKGIHFDGVNDSIAVTSVTADIQTTSVSVAACLTPTHAVVGAVVASAHRLRIRASSDRSDGTT